MKQQSYIASCAVFIHSWDVTCMLIGNLLQYAVHNAFDNDPRRLPYSLYNIQLHLYNYAFAY